MDHWTRSVKMCLVQDKHRLNPIDVDCLDVVEDPGRITAPKHDRWCTFFSKQMATNAIALIERFRTSPGQGGDPFRASTVLVPAVRGIDMSCQQLLRKCASRFSYHYCPRRQSFHLQLHVQHGCLLDSSLVPEPELAVSRWRERRHTSQR